jgi:hypothetical protein
MLSMKRFRNASITIIGLEYIHRIRKGQFNLGTLRIKDKKTAAVWNTVLAHEPTQTQERSIECILKI